MIIKVFRCVAVFLFGGFAYGLLEVLWRGYTHISMIITGGACFLTLHKIFVSFPRLSIVKRFLISSLTITLAELLTGILTNRILKLNVWDYSDKKINFLGQICLPFSLLWGFIGLGISLISPGISRHFDVINKKDIR